MFRNHRWKIEKRTPSNIKTLTGVGWRFAYADLHNNSLINFITVKSVNEDENTRQKATSNPAVYKS